MSDSDVFNPVSLPRLVEFDWCFDVVAASNNINRMAVPTCLLRLKVADYGNSNEEKVQVKTVQLSKQTLDTMLDGLGKIRDQLNSVVSK
ncbi:COMM domain-containing protein 9 [Hydra vulgaris]|uniref:COMM domain-containing protein 9 n=1 Tax=Hydra vulgaris TaxID=6087 RepID=T2M4P4_HYDVU|nr:COMM domain-containing protein 9-like isoform X2 [Hydra vulgaris]